MSPSAIIVSVVAVVEGPFDDSIFVEFCGSVRSSVGAVDISAIATERSGSVGGLGGTVVVSVSAADGSGSVGGSGGTVVISVIAAEGAVGNSEVAPVGVSVIVSEGAVGCVSVLALSEESVAVSSFPTGGGGRSAESLTKP